MEISRSKMWGLLLDQLNAESIFLVPPLCAGGKNCQPSEKITATQGPGLTGEVHLLHDTKQQQCKWIIAQSPAQHSAHGKLLALCRVHFGAIRCSQCLLLAKTAIGGEDFAVCGQRASFLHCTQCRLDNWCARVLDDVALHQLLPPLEMPWSFWLFATF